jgi:hypothetical protein
LHIGFTQYIYFKTSNESTKYYNLKQYIIRLEIKKNYQQNTDYVISFEFDIRLDNYIIKA